MFSKHFKFISPGSIIIGLDPNAFCEKHAIKRLNEVKSTNINLKDYLIGYSENMSYIKANSIDVVICTNALSSCQDVNQTLAEIYRILKIVSEILFN